MRRGSLVSLNGESFDVFSGFIKPAPAPLNDATVVGIRFKHIPARIVVARTGRRRIVPENCFGPSRQIVSETGSQNVETGATSFTRLNGAAALSVRPPLFSLLRFLAPHPHHPACSQQETDTPRNDACSEGLSPPPRPFGLVFGVFPCVGFFLVYIRYRGFFDHRAAE